MNKYEKSNMLYKEALKFIPGGVNSPVRAFKSVNRDPIFIERAKGSKIYDVDGNEYIDYIGSWGPMILGHNHEKIVKEIQQALNKGSAFGLATAQEIKLAKLINECVPSIDKVRLTSSGTEAVMAAIRLSRAYTGRKKIIKFEGCYHGHSDSLLVKAGSGALTYNILDSNGITESVINDTITLAYNDIDQINQAFRKFKNEIAAVIIEPIAANMGVIIPKKDFLINLREITESHGTVLIFDEVITGFRIGLGGAQNYYGINPDLTILGKIIGGGYPIGAFGGKEEIMAHIAPEGKVYHAGTLSGNLISVTAGIATIMFLKDNHDIYNFIEKNVQYLTDNIEKLALNMKLDITINSIASLFTVFFTKEKVNDLSGAQKANVKTFSLYFNSMLERGILIPPSQYEANFVSAAHSKDDIEKTVSIINECFKKFKK